MSTKASVTSEQQQQETKNCPMTRKTDQVLVLVAFDRGLHRAFCNACIREKSIIRNYTGRLVGHTESVEVVEGNWPKQLTVGVLLFESSVECKKWITSDPLFRAQDFLDQVEMYCIPLSIPLPQDMKVLQIMNLDVVFKEVLHDQYISDAEDGVRKHGGVPFVAFTNSSVKAKGLRNPGFVAINAWKSPDDFAAHYNGDCYQKLKEIRLQAASGDMILANLTDVI